MTEEWKIIDFAPMYAVSNKGQVKNTKTDRILKPATTNLGYKNVGLRKDNKTYFRLIHRLVAQAFIPNPECLPEVNHKDFDKTNNNVENLEWVDHRQNMMHTYHADNPNKLANELNKVIKEIINKYVVFQ